MFVTAADPLLRTGSNPKKKILKANMKHKRIQMTKDQIIAELRHKKISKEMMFGYRLAMLIVVTELDEREVDPDEINDFLSGTQDKLQMYANGELDAAKWAAAVEEYTNIDCICNIDQEI